MLNVKRSCKTHSGMTHAEIGALLGLSKQHVQQIEVRAIRKLRATMGSSYEGAIASFLKDACGIPEPWHTVENDREG